MGQMSARGLIRQTRIRATRRVVDANCGRVLPDAFAGARPFMCGSKWQRIIECTLATLRSLGCLDWCFPESPAARLLPRGERDREGANLTVCGFHSFSACACCNVDGGHLGVCHKASNFPEMLSLLLRSWEPCIWLYLLKWNNFFRRLKGFHDFELPWIA